MKTTDYLAESGMEWESYSGGKTLWELYNDKDVFSACENPNQAEKLAYLFEYRGVLKIQDRKQFAEHFEIGMELESLTENLINRILIHIHIKTTASGKIDLTYTTCGIDWKDIDTYIFSEIDDETKEKFLPGFALEKIFHGGQAWGKLTRQIIETMENILKNITVILDQKTEQVIQQLIGYCESPQNPVQA